MILSNYGYVRAAACSPRVQVGDISFNTKEIVKMIREASEKGVGVMAFPELALTGYTCADLFNQRALIQAAEQGLGEILAQTRDCPVLAAVGLPVAAQGRLYNCAAVIFSGTLLGLVPKTFIPNYNEFYEKRWFSSSAARSGDAVRFLGQDVPFGEDLLFKNQSSALTIGVEICEDLWMPMAPSARLALRGANLILNLSASDENVSKADYRRELVRQQSGRCYCGYVYASAGQGESTTDLVYSGHCIIAASDIIAAETSYNPDSALIFADIDIEKLLSDRQKFGTFMDEGIPEGRAIAFDLKDERDVAPAFTVQPHPFIPSDKSQKDLRCREIFKIQSVGLAERMRKTGIQKAVLGLSGGLDSTLALLVTVHAVESLGLPAENVHTITMPGMGTTDRTYRNALTLMEELGTTIREISIREACKGHFRDIGHDGKTPDVTYENAQARERTQILFDVANMVGGLVVGTGDMSELALGWCTYNGDHMSNYAVNAGVPKSLVRHLVSWYAETTPNQKAAETLRDILATPISPELLPADESGAISQKTEDLVGPYELHDFFLYHMLRNGFSPKKILKLALMAFEGVYAPEVVLKWLETFYKRFFAQQFKRSCLPDGVKVGSVCLSPRGDWRMPSDASPRAFLEELARAAECMRAGTL